MRNLQLKTGMSFLGHALCAGGCVPHKSTFGPHKSTFAPHKSTFAPQGDVCTPPQEKNLHNWQK